VKDLERGLDVANEYAAEHLILEVREPRRWLEKVSSAGSVFLGAWSPEPMGDYCSGTNHVLPTYGYARAYSGLSVLDFVKRITVQELTPDGLRALGPIAVSLARSRCLVVKDLESALDVANDYAPEHLILEVREPRRWLTRVASAGSVFLGTWSPEPMGDYCSGTNHVLPTYGYARAYSGLSVLDFVKRITVQELTPEGLRALGPIAVSLAHLEGLDAHAGAVTRRLAALDPNTGAAPLARSGS